MSQVNEIRTLQELDDEGAAFRAALSDVERRLRGSEELNEARRVFATADEELTGMRKEQRRIDGLIEGLTARIVPEEKRLYDGSVKNSKELVSIQHEVDLLRGQRSKLEDGLLELLGRLEAADREHIRSQQIVTQEEARWEKEREDLKHESKRLQDSIDRADGKRDAQKIKVTPRSLHVYEDVRRRRGGMAVAKIQGSTCSGCRISIPDAVRKKAFSPDQLAQCLNCERILYIG